MSIRSKEAIACAKASLARRMADRRRELIARPLGEIWEELAAVAMDGSDHAPSGNMPARLSDGTIDNILSKLDQGAAYQGYAEGFGFSWTQLAGDAATIIRRLRQQAAPPARSAASTVEPVALAAALRKAMQTAQNDDLSEPRSDKRQRHIDRADAILNAAEYLERLAAPTTSPEPNCSKSSSGSPEPDAVREALRPFADLADRLSDKHRDSRPLFFALDQPTEITVGDIRRAAAALSRPAHGGETVPNMDLYQTHAAATAAAQAFFDAAEYEAAMWTGYGEQIVPPYAEMRCEKAAQAMSALRDAQALARNDRDTETERRT